MLAPHPHKHNGRDFTPPLQHPSTKNNKRANNSPPKRMHPLLHRLQGKLPKRFALALSGGVDSSALLTAAVQLRPRSDILALTVTTPYTATDESITAKKLCQKLGITHHVITLPIPESIQNNPQLRCYHCKTEIFTQLLGFAHKNGFHTLCDGSIHDDLSEYRPGRKALQELHITSPLQEAQFSKTEVRELARALKLPPQLSNKPNSACLLTRLEHDTPININDLRRIETAENILHTLGIINCRVRLKAEHHAHIELRQLAPPKEYWWESMSSQFQTLNFTQITMENNATTQLGHTQIDHDRLERTGAPEVIYGAGKSSQQIIDIAEAMLAHGNNVLATRLDAEKAVPILKHFPEAKYSTLAELLSITPHPRPLSESFIAIVSAGTSDQKIVEEAALTAEFLGSRVERIQDCGVAGIQRLLNALPLIRQARVIIAIAGMEGALPSVLAGLVKTPVIAVPTSIGYGTNLEGITTLLAMMTSCANGVSVVNIDNGFGAAYNAHLINSPALFD